MSYIELIPAFKYITMNKVKCSYKKHKKDNVSNPPDDENKKAYCYTIQIRNGAEKISRESSRSSNPGKSK